jgi:hypothetical protein
MTLSEQLCRGKMEKDGELFKVSWFATRWQVKAITLLIRQAM